MTLRSVHRRERRRIDARATAGGLQDPSRELAELYATTRKSISAWSLLTVGDVLDRWLDSDHDWRPSTWVATRPTAKAVRADGRRGTTFWSHSVRARGRATT